MGDLTVRTFASEAACLVIFSLSFLDLLWLQIKSLSMFPNNSLMCQLVQSHETFILVQLSEVGGKVKFPHSLTASRYEGMWENGGKAPSTFDRGTGTDNCSLCHATGLHCWLVWYWRLSVGRSPWIGMSECNFTVTWNTRPARDSCFKVLWRVLTSCLRIFHKLFIVFWSLWLILKIMICFPESLIRCSWVGE
jgi:hypothetical protein